MCGRFQPKLWAKLAGEAALELLNIFFFKFSMITKVMIRLIRQKTKGYDFIRKINKYPVLRRTDNSAFVYLANEIIPCMF